MTRAFERADGGQCGVVLLVLTDALQDHTLAGETLSRRLAEVCQRWTQSLRSLWMHSECTFCIRLAKLAGTGEIRIGILARPAAGIDRASLKETLELTLVSSGVIRPSEIWRSWLPLLNRAEVMELVDQVDEAERLAQSIERAFAPLLEVAEDPPSMIAITPRAADDLWQHPDALSRMAARALGEREYAKWQGEAKAWLPQPWGGPFGGFLEPFQALLAVRSDMTVSFYATPTTASVTETRWLLELCRLASSPLVDGNDVDPSSAGVARAATKTLAEVLRHPWLCAATVIGSNGRDQGAVTVAAALHGLVQHRDSDLTPDFACIPSARLVHAETDQRDQVLRDHAALRFPRWCDDGAKPRPLRRLDYIGGASSAATLFRLPLSIRGGVPGVTVEQPAPDFIPGPRHQHPTTPVDPGRALDQALRSRAPGPTVALGRFREGGELRIELSQFAKHTLVTGFTGSGKTNTVLNLLCQLWSPDSASPGVPRIPFLVIESAKQEYRGLLGLPAFSEAHASMKVFTVGNETCAPIRLNPFTLLPGVRVESHIGRLRACFEGALPPLPWLPNLLAEAIEHVYLQRWWQLTDSFPSSGAEHRTLPTMADFYKALAALIDQRDYGLSAKDVKAATLGRMKILMTGSVGAALGGTADQTRHCISTMMTHPTVVELNDLNLDDKALVTLFLLTFLREYREHAHMTQPRTPFGLSHVTVVEEAHNVLGRHASQGTGEAAGSDVKAKSVEAFCNMLTEIRSLGEGIIISDQSPGKLAPDAMRNTNIQIAHQLRDANDREAVAAAMIMDDAQADFLGKLKPGHAAVFTTGLEKASFVLAHDILARHPGFMSSCDDETVKARMDAVVASYRRPTLPFSGCSGCTVRLACPHRAPVLQQLFERREAAMEVRSSLFEGIRRLAASKAERNDRVAASREILEKGTDDVVERLLGGNLANTMWTEVWCLLLHVAHGMPDGTRPAKPSQVFDIDAGLATSVRERVKAMKQRLTDSHSHAGKPPPPDA